MPATILFIDANVSHTELMGTLLKAKGYNVVVARKGADGVALAQERAFDLIFVDSTLPDRTGFQICKEIRQALKAPSTPIVLMSGLARFANQQAFASERGAREMVYKPLQLIQLGEIVDRYIPPPEAPR